MFQSKMDCCNEDGLADTDLFKPGSDDRYPVLNGGDGVWVADS